MGQSILRRFACTALAVIFLLSLGTSGPAHAQDFAAVSQARQHLADHAAEFGVPEGAAQSARVTSSHTSNVSGVTYVYLKQTLDGVDVRDGDMTVAIGRDGTVFHAAGAFQPAVMASRGAGASLSAVNAAEVVMRHYGHPPVEAVAVLEETVGQSSRTVLSTGGVARSPIEAWLTYEPTEEGKVYRLAWEVIFDEPEGNHRWSVGVDAATGEILREYDLVLECSFGEGEAHDLADHSSHDHFLRYPDEAGGAPVSRAASAAAMGQAAARSVHESTYRAFPSNIESPSHGERELIVNPADPVASPYGWHTTTPSDTPTYTITRGNNIHAYADVKATNQPNSQYPPPDGGSDLVFDHPLDLTQQPSAYRDASVTNLFYMSNMVHDVLYHHGFDEAAGNYQHVNYTGHGAAGDAIRAEAQDGTMMNNARFWMTPDGQPGRIEMFLWNHTNPHRDGDFDNVIIAHEYGHGWSTRLTGGPNQTCLQNSEQMGEGWSDFLGVVMTINEGDLPEMHRGVGTYVLGQPTAGPGIRPAPYSTDMSINNYTYGNLGGLAVPHGVGFLWNTMLWEMTWNLIDTYGFDSDLINGNGGNKIALTLVSEAMKLQPCSPGFVDGRDAILAADEAIYYGAHASQIWQAFAKRGLGYSASQGSPSSTSDGTEAFDTPGLLVSPTGLNFEVGVNSTSTAQIVMGNLGADPVNWEFDEETTIPGLPDPSRDEVLDVPDFAIAPSSPSTAIIPGGITSSGDVIGFTFEGTVEMSGSADWASDMRMILTSPSGDSFNVGGSSGTVNDWDFQGSSSSSNGTYTSTHMDVFGDLGTGDEGDWTVAFSHGWSGGSTMTWSDVTITLHKAADVECGAPWLSTSPETGSTGPGDAVNVNVTANATGMDLGEHDSVLCITSDDEGNPLSVLNVTMTVEESVPGAGPVATFDPAINVGIDETVEPGESTVALLTIGNTGDQDLVWSIDQGDAGRGTHEPSLDEELPIPDFSVAPSSPAEFDVPGGVTTSGSVIGFTFEGTVSGIGGSSDWASDMKMIMTSPTGDVYDVGGFGGTVNDWDFQGGGSGSDGFYASVHLDAFPEGTEDVGDWNFAFTHTWSSGVEMTWTDVTVTLHKAGLPVPPSFITEISPASGTVGPGTSVEVEITLDSDGFPLGTFGSVLDITTNESSDARGGMAPHEFERLPAERKAAIRELNRGGTSYDYPVTMHVVGQTNCTITPSPIAFGGVVTGLSETIEATLTNEGDYSCTIETASTDEDDFTVDFDGPVTLEPGESIDFEVAFTPSDHGAASGTLTFSGDQDDVTAGLSGTGLIPPVAEVDPTSLTFHVNPDQPEETQIVTLSNSGTSDATDLEYNISVVLARPEARPEGGRPVVSGVLDAANGSAARGSQAREGGIMDGGPFPQTEFGRGGGDELIQDGSFEEGTPNPHWTEFSDYFGTPICSVSVGCNPAVGSGANTGDWWLWFGGLFEEDETAFVEQQLVIPSGGAELSFWLEIPTAETDGWLRVSIDGEVLFEATHDDAPEYSTYQEVVLDASAFSDGGTHNIRFEAFSQAGGLLNMFVDDVSLLWTGPPVLVLDPTSGAVEAGESVEISVTALMGELEQGVYEFDLQIQTNDPENPLIVLDATVVVEGVSDEPGSTPVEFALAQNYPNPFAASTTIEFALPESGPVSIEVFDLAGRLVTTLVDGEMEAGNHSTTWNANGVASGVYLYRIQAGSFSQTLRALVVR